MPYKVSMMGWVGSGEDFCGLGWVEKFWVGLGFEKVTHDQLWFRVACPGSLVLFTVPCFTQATFAKARSYEKQLRRLPASAAVESTDVTTLIEDNTVSKCVLTL